MGYLKHNIEDSKVYNESYECINVLSQDPEYIGFNLFLASQLAQTTLSVDATLNASTITVASATGITAGKALNITQGARIFQSLIANITGNIITLASPLDFGFASGATISVGDWNLNQNGSTTPIIFEVQPPPDAIFHIRTISITITDNDTMDDGRFGGIPALTKGIICRRVNGSTFNYYLVTNNRGFYQAGYEKDYNDRAGGTGVFGVEFRKSLLESNGSVISLSGATNDKFQVIVPSDLTLLTEFTVSVHGHIAEY